MSTFTVHPTPRIQEPGPPKIQSQTHPYPKPTLGPRVPEINQPNLENPQKKIKEYEKQRQYY
jgi:hypothetical protein